jgi:hypothetical protein
VSAVADKLREAKALIEKGWTRHEFESGDCVCATGAILRAYNLAPFGSDLEKFRRLEATKLLQDAVGAEQALGGFGVNSIVAWNDREDRTQAEVLAAFDRAIELAETQDA